MTRDKACFLSLFLLLAIFFPAFSGAASYQPSTPLFTPTVDTTLGSGSDGKASHTGNAGYTSGDGLGSPDNFRDADSVEIPETITDTLRVSIIDNNADPGSELKVDVNMSASGAHDVLNPMTVTGTLFLDVSTLPNPGINTAVDWTNFSTLSANLTFGANKTLTDDLNWDVNLPRDGNIVWYRVRAGYKDPGASTDDINVYHRFRQSSLKAVQSLTSQNSDYNASKVDSNSRVILRMEVGYLNGADVNDYNKLGVDENFDVNLEDPGGTVVQSQRILADRNGFMRVDFNLPAYTLPGTWTVDANYGHESDTILGTRTFTVKPVIERIATYTRNSSDQNVLGTRDDMNRPLRLDVNIFNDLTGATVSCNVDFLNSSGSALGNLCRGTNAGCSNISMTANAAAKTCRLDTNFPSHTGQIIINVDLTVNSQSTASGDNKSVDDALIDALDPTAIHQPRRVSYSSVTSNTQSAVGSNGLAGISGTAKYTSGDGLAGNDNFRDADSVAVPETITDTLQISIIDNNADPGSKLSIDVNGTSSGAHSVIATTAFNGTLFFDVSTAANPGINTAGDWTNVSSFTANLTFPANGTQTNDLNWDVNLPRDGNISFYRVRAGFTDPDSGADDINVYHRFKQTTLKWTQNFTIEGSTNPYNPSIRDVNNVSDANSNFIAYGEIAYLNGADFNDYDLNASSDANIRFYHPNGHVETTFVKTIDANGFFFHDQNLKPKTPPGRWRLDVTYNHGSDNNTRTSVRDVNVKPVIYSITTYKRTTSGWQKSFIFDLNQRMRVDVNFYNDINAVGITCTLSLSDGNQSLSMDWNSTASICRKELDATKTSGFKVMRITADVNSVTGTSGDSLSTKNALVDVNVGDFNLAVTEADISFSANPASNGQAIEVTAVIRNSSVISDANDVNVAFYKSSVSASNLLGHTTLQVAKQSNASAVLAWTVTESSDVNVVVQIDPVNDLNDYNPGDNLAGKVLTILSTGCRAPASGTWNVQEADVCDKNGIDLNGPVATSSAGGMTMLDSNWVFRQANDGNFFVKAAGTNPFKMRGSRVDVNAGSSFRFDFNIESGTDNNLDSANLSTARIYLKTETRTWAYSTDLNNLHLLGTADLNCPNITKHCTLKGLLDVNGSTTVAVISGYVRTSSLPLESVFFDTGAKLVRFFPITVKNQNDSGVSGADINVFNSVGELMWSCAACTDSSGNGLARVDFNKGTKDQNFVVHVRKQGLFFADTNYMFKDVNVTVVSNAPLEFVLSPAGSLPFADAGNDQVVRTGGSDANVTLDPSNSFDPDNDNGTTRGICRFEWDFNSLDNDGNFTIDWNSCDLSTMSGFGCDVNGCSAPLGGQGKITRALPLGEHVLRLRVRDNNGLQDTASVLVTVAFGSGVDQATVAAPGFSAESALLVFSAFLLFAFIRGLFIGKRVRRKLKRR